jgi:hypothetical protein
VLVFDNKGKVQADSTEIKPRLGVVIAGVVEPVLAGDSSVLKAQDLESLSLVDQEKALYLAVTSLGQTHIFILEEGGGPGSAATTFSAKQVATGQLPVPSDESTSWKDHNRTNIEATRCFGSPPPSVVTAAKLGEGYVPGTPIIVYGGRGGDGYAGKMETEGTKPHGCWLRFATFDMQSGTPVRGDTALWSEMMLENVGEDKNWRGLSSLDVVGNHLYFSAAFDGEDYGYEIDTTDAARARCAFFGRNLHSRMSLVPTLVRLK